MNIKRGIKLLQEIQGKGRPAEKGDQIVYNLKIFLNKGEEVPLNQIQSRNIPEEMTREEAGYLFVNHKTVLGSREPIPAVEFSLMGMKKGGYRKVKASPYREKGIPGLIPGNAVLILEIWCRKILNCKKNDD